MGLGNLSSSTVERGQQRGNSESACLVCAALHGLRLARSANLKATPEGSNFKGQKPELNETRGELLRQERKCDGH